MARLTNHGAKTIRESKLVFIGKNLDHEELREGFAACVLTPEMKQRRLDELKEIEENLRFSVGDKVECNTDDGWVEGEVVALMYREGGFGIAPYQVRLNDGVLIYAPKDHDGVIRAA